MNYLHKVRDQKQANTLTNHYKKPCQFWSYEMIDIESIVGEIVP